MKRSKISIIGGGFVGSTCAHIASMKELGDIILLDLQGDIAQGKALDLFESTPLSQSDIHIGGGQDYALTKGSDVVIITAGLPRKPGMSRDDLLETNAKIVQHCCQQIVQYSPEAVLIVVSNPLDAMCHVALKTTHFSPKKVIGMAGVLDSARFRSFIALELGVSVKDIHAFVFGGHGDTMVPLPRYVTVGGIPLPQLLSEEKIQSLVARTRQGGAEIVSYLKTGSAYYAPAASVIEMTESILKDQKRILPCAAYLQGEYGVQDLFCGVLVQLGSSGIEKIPLLELNESEKKEFKKSADSVQELVNVLSKKGM